MEVNPKNLVTKQEKIHLVPEIESIELKAFLGINFVMTMNTEE